MKYELRILFRSHMRIYFKAKICYVDNEPVGIARCESGWVMYDARREINRCEVPWEDLFAMCRDCTPAILFYEVIK